MKGDTRSQRVAHVGIWYGIGLRVQGLGFRVQSQGLRLRI